MFNRLVGLFKGGSSEEGRSMSFNSSTSVEQEIDITEVPKDEVSSTNFNRTTSMQLSALYRGVSLLAGTTARLPIGVYEVEGDGDKRKLRDHPYSRLLNVSANHIVPAFNYRETMMLDLVAGDGNHYAHKLRDRAGNITGLRRIDTQRVSPFLVDDADDYNLYYFIDGRKQPSTKLDIVHVAGMGFDGVRGISPLEVMKKVGRHALVLDRFSQQFFENGAHLGGVIEMPDGFKNADFITRYVETFNKMHNKLKSVGGTGAIPKGGKYHQFQLLAEAAQLLNSRKFSIVEIGRFLGVPPHKLFELERSTNNNIEHQNIEWVLDTVAIWCRRIETALEHALLRPSERGHIIFRHDLSELIKGDMKSVAEYLSKLVNSGILTSDEAREFLDYFKMGHEAAKLRFPVNTASIPNNKDNE